ncbi:hypothetical protein [Dyadobacter sp. LHD-138]|uniref:hypothetical protein n=1 Tax=Dyadobacter sp. LHD-138 TaxID=3071413 RepID=UPI0027E206EE|nr:hypothetical protein [Dyadobacter sp. LHD-138]MDQ6482128.1 hypothetical protein [Dyadobacter sp. LHD-138]
MKKTLLVVVIVLFSLRAQAQSQDYIDMLGGHKGFTSEFFFLKPIDKANRWSVISRSELHLIAYKRDHPEFVNYNTVSYNFKNHFGITAGTYASSVYPFSARLGVQYMKETEALLIYANLSSAVTKDPDGHMLVILGYLPEINEKWRLVFRSELRTAISYKHGHAFSTQQVKAGLQYNEKLGFGLGVEAGQHGKSEHLEKEFNIGPFVRINL